MTSGTTQSNASGSNSNKTTWRAALTSKLSVKARLVLATTMYMIATAVVWQHFFYKRLNQMERRYAKSLGSTNYYQKVFVPPFVYATKHTILLTMVALMLTMCRKTVGLLSRSAINRFLPLDSTVEMHKLLGTWMLTQTLFAFVGFGVQYGSLCFLYKQGKEVDNFCAKFGGEIYITGVLISLICVAMLVTALPSIRRRFKWPFELFWSVHHSFIALYILTVAHTIDSVARRSGLASRSQCGLWLIPPMLLYTFDRWWQNHTTRRTYLESVKLLGKPKALVVRLARPPGWRYNCGQYARINVPAVSRSEWHPFSISSAPHQSYVEFFIAVVPGGWTERFYTMMQRATSLGDQQEVVVLLDGPYGSQLQGAFNSPDMVLMSTGTGVVPMLSVLRQLTATPSVALSAGQGPLVPVQLGIADTLPGGSKQLSAERQEFWNEAELVYMPDEVRRQGLRRLANLGSRRFKYGPLSFKLGRGETDTLMQKDQAKAQRRDELRHPGEYARQVFRLPDAVFAAAGQMQRRQVLYTLSVQQTWWSLGAVALVALQLLLGCLQVSWSSGSMQVPQWWFKLNLLTVVAAVGMLVFIIKHAHNAHQIYHGRPAVRNRGQQIMLSLRAAWKTLLHSGEDGVEAVLMDSSWVLHLLVVVGLLAVCLMDADGGTQGDKHSVLLVLLTTLLRLYQMMYHLNTTPLFLIKGPENSQQLALKAAFASSVHFAWSTQTAESFMWIMEELDEIAGQLVATRGAHFLRIQVSITRASPEEKEQLRGLLAGTLLEGCVKFGRLNYAQMLRDLCTVLKQNSTTPQPSATFSPADTADLLERGSGSTTRGMYAAGRQHPSRVTAGKTQDAPGPSQLCACVVLALFFCGHPVIAAELEKAVEQIGHESAGQPGAPLIMYGSETVFG